MSKQRQVKSSDKRCSTKWNLNEYGRAEFSRLWWIQASKVILPKPITVTCWTFTNGFTNRWKDALSLDRSSAKGVLSSARKPHGAYAVSAVSAKDSQLWPFSSKQTDRRNGDVRWIHCHKPASKRPLVRKKFWICFRTLSPFIHDSFLHWDLGSSPHLDSILPDTMILSDTAPGSNVNVQSAVHYQRIPTCTKLDKILDGTLHSSLRQHPKPVFRFISMSNPNPMQAQVAWVIEVEIWHTEG